MSKNLSASKIITYNNCPMKYKFQYIDLIPVKVKTDALELGSKVHEYIATGADPAGERLIVRFMVQKARAFLETMPPNPIMETTHEDEKNPCRIYGKINGRPFTGIFDVLYLDPHHIAIDWKSGFYHSGRYNINYDIQAWVLNALYRYNFATGLKSFVFKFLREGPVYDPSCIWDQTESDRVGDLVADLIGGIEAEEWQKKEGPLCNYCDCKKECRK